MNFDIIKLIIILVINSIFVYLMIKKKISTLLALPLMGILTAFSATLGTSPNLAIFDQTSKILDPKTKLPIVKEGIMNGVISKGTIMMASAVSATIFGSAFSKMINKVGIGKQIVKSSAEMAGDRPLVIAFVFFIMTTIIFAAIGGLGGVILVGSVALPIMLSSGISPINAASIILLGLSTGGLINPANYATFAAILAPTLKNPASAYNLVAQMSIILFIIVFSISSTYIIIMLLFFDNSKYSSVKLEIPKIKKGKKLPFYVLITPIIPVLLIVISTLWDNHTFSAELAISIGLIYLLITSRVSNKMGLLVSCFVDGLKDVSGAIILLMGLGILIKGFQFPQVQIIITPIIVATIKNLNNPVNFVIGFTLATPLVLYRGPLNTFGIGGVLPVIFASAGFSPLAIIWVLRATGNMQGFGDPTNSQNIWIADFVQVEPFEITKKLFLLGMIISLILLCYSVFIIKIPLKLV